MLHSVHFYYVLFESVVETLLYSKRPVITSNAIAKIQLTD